MKSKNTPPEGSNKSSEPQDEDISLAWQPAVSNRNTKQAMSEDLDEDADVGRVTNEEDQAGTLRFRAPVQRKYNWARIGIRSFWVLMVAIVLVGSTIFALRFNKKFRTSFVSYGIQLSKLSDEYGFPNQISNGIRRISYAVLNLGPRKQKGHTKGDRLTGCAATIESLLDKKLRANFTGTDYYNLGGCLLLSDRYELAREYVKIEELRISRLKAWSDDDLNKKLIALEVYRRSDAFSLRNQIYKNFCETWKYDPNCFLRFVEEARQPIRLQSEQGFSVMEKQLNKEMPKKAGWMYFAAGLVAAKNSDFSQAEIRFNKGQIIARSTQDKYLQREIFKARIKSLWEANKLREIEQVWHQMPAEIYSEDPRLFLDIEYLRAIGLPNADVKNLTAVYLERPESYLRFNDDLNFVRLIIYNGLKSKEYERVFSYLQNLEGLGIKGFKQEQNASWLKINKIRALYPQGSNTKIQQILSTLSQDQSNTAEVHHLLGLIRIKGRTEKGALLLAADNFRQAIRLGNRDFSIFALIVCLLEMRDLKGAEMALRAWPSGNSGVEDSWRSFAKGLLIYASGDHAQAMQVWNEILHKDKSLLFVQILMHNLRDDPEYMQGRIFEVLSQILPVESPLGALALFVQKA